MENLVIDGTSYSTQLTNKFANRKKYEPRDPKLVLSYIPGNIKIINVKKGQTVKVGEQLLVLEAMKMKNSIKAPITGKIKSVNVIIDQMVPKEYCMIEFE